MRDGNIAHVVANGSVAEDRKAMTCSKNAFLNGLGRLIAAVQFLHALDLSRETVNAQADSGIFHHVVDVDGLHFAASTLAVEVDALASVRPPQTSPTLLSPYSSTVR